MSRKGITDTFLLLIISGISVGMLFVGIFYAYDSFAGDLGISFEISHLVQSYRFGFTQKLVITNVVTNVTNQTTCIIECDGSTEEERICMDDAQHELEENRILCQTIIQPCIDNCVGQQDEIQCIQDCYDSHESDFEDCIEHFTLQYQDNLRDCLSVSQSQTCIRDCLSRYHPEFDYREWIVYYTYYLSPRAPVVIDFRALTSSIVGDEFDEYAYALFFEQTPYSYSYGNTDSFYVVKQITYNDSHNTTVSLDLDSYGVRNVKTFYLEPFILGNENPGPWTATYVGQSFAPPVIEVNVKVDDVSLVGSNAITVVTIEGDAVKPGLNPCPEAIVQLEMTDRGGIFTELPNSKFIISANRSRGIGSWYTEHNYASRYRMRFSVTNDVGVDIFSDETAEVILNFTSISNYLNYNIVDCTTELVITDNNHRKLERNVTSQTVSGGRCTSATVQFVIPSTNSIPFLHGDTRDFYVYFGNPTGGTQADVTGTYPRFVFDSTHRFGLGTFTNTTTDRTGYSGKVTLQEAMCASGLEYQEVPIVALESQPSFCGDGICDLDENCYTCPQDCFCKGYEVCCAPGIEAHVPGRDNSNCAIQDENTMCGFYCNLGDTTCSPDLGENQESCNVRKGDDRHKCSTGHDHDFDESFRHDGWWFSEMSTSRLNGAAVELKWLFIQSFQCGGTHCGYGIGNVVCKDNCDGCCCCFEETKTSCPTLGCKDCCSNCNYWIRTSIYQQPPGSQNDCKPCNTSCTWMYLGGADLFSSALCLGLTDWGEYRLLEHWNEYYVNYYVSQFEYNLYCPRSPGDTIYTQTHAVIFSPSNYSGQHSFAGGCDSARCISGICAGTGAEVCCSYECPPGESECLDPSWENRCDKTGDGIACGFWTCASPTNPGRWECVDDVLEHSYNPGSYQVNMSENNLPRQVNLTSLNFTVYLNDASNEINAYWSGIGEAWSSPATLSGETGQKIISITPNRDKTNFIFKVDFSTGNLAQPPVLEKIEAVTTPRLRNAQQDNNSAEGICWPITEQFSQSFSAEHQVLTCPDGVEGEILSYAMLTITEYRESNYEDNFKINSTLQQDIYRCWDG